jgi:PAS domain S-box-containing protein
VEVKATVPAHQEEMRTWQTFQYPLRDDEGSVVGVARVVVDITDQKHAEVVQREQAELLALANETVIVRNPDSSITRWNQAAEQMYGYSAHEAVGRNSHELLQTRFPKSKQAVLTSLLEAGSWQGELRHLRKDGSVIFVLSHQSMQRDVRGEPAAILEVNWDITERVRVKEELRELNATLERRVDERTAELSALNKQLEAFTYTIAHDLRTPLRSVQGFAEALREDYVDLLDGDGRDMLRRIANSAERMDDLIRDLLEYSRLTRTQLPVEPTELSEVFRVVLGQVQGELERRGAVVRIEAPMPRVLGHPGALVQVVTNLLTNAVKFVAAGTAPQVRVWAETRGNCARVYVQDNGIGVDERHHERIWQVFERLHTLEEYPGTGVGLAIVQKSLEQMNGTVGVQASTQGGSCFWFELPRADGGSRE